MEAILFGLIIWAGSQGGAVIIDKVQGPKERVCNDALTRCRTVRSRHADKTIAELNAMDAPVATVRGSLVTLNETR